MQKMARQNFPIFLILVSFSHLFAVDLQPNLGDEHDTKGENGCDCVPFFLCNNGSINTDGAGIINIRKNEGPCNNVMDVCCKPEDKSPKHLTITPPPVLPTKGCGYRHPYGVSFQIIGNNQNEAQFGEFPWMVSITRHNGDKSCGGALIHPRAVITAAHCVKKTESYFIRAGEWDYNNTNEPYPHQDVNVKSITIHPEFYSGALFNDIAFLYLETNVKINAHIDTICLPPQNFHQNAGRCYSSGWGKNIFGPKGKYQNFLKRIDLPQVPRDICQKKLRNTRLGKYFILHESFTCAGGELGKDTCDGDGGSPLVCPIAGQEDRYYQAGIVSWGIGCAEAHIPAVYVNVASFRNWIDEQMVYNGLDIKQYEFESKK